jgi:hypothetical protein
VRIFIPIRCALVPEIGGNAGVFKHQKEHFLLRREVVTKYTLKLRSTAAMDKPFSVESGGEVKP